MEVKEDKDGSTYKKLCLVCISVFVLVVGTGIVAPLLTPYAQTLKASGIEIGLLFSGFYFVRIIMGPYIGILADKKGPKAILRYSLILYPLIGVMYVMASSYPILILARLFHGLASAMMLPMVMTYIGQISPIGKESKYMGIYNTVIYLANAVGPSAGAFISDRYGYQIAFSSLFILSLLSLFIVCKLPASELGVKEGKKEGEGKKRTFRNINMKLVAIGSINVVAMIFSVFTVSFYAIYLSSIGINVAIIGFILTINNLIIGSSQLFIAGIIDRLNKKLVIVFASITIAAIVLALLHTQTVGIIIFLFVILSFASSALLLASSALATIIGRDDGMGETMGFIGSASSLGAVIGPIVLGALVDFVNIQATFWFVIGIWLIGVILFLVIYRDDTEMAVVNNEY